MDQLLNQFQVEESIRTLIGMAIILVGTVLVATILRSVVFATIGRFTARTGSTLDDKLVAAGKTYLALLIYLFGFSVLFEFIADRYPDYIGPKMVAVVHGVLYALGVLVVSILIIKVISAVLSWYADVIAARTETMLDDEFIPLLDRAVKIVVITLSLLIILDHFDVDVKGLVAVLGVGSLAVALAAQDTLANMIGGFTIMIDRPFRVGDMVQLPTEGKVTVHEIGIRSTKFRTFENTLVIVPNAERVKATVHNITYPDPHIRVTIDVGVSYGSDMNLVQKLLLDAAANHKNVLTKPAPYYLFLDYGASSLDVSLRCYTSQPDLLWQVASDLRHEILNQFRKHNIEIPFPQRVVTMVNDNQEDNADKEQP